LIAWRFSIIPVAFQKTGTKRPRLYAPPVANTPFLAHPPVISNPQDFSVILFPPRSKSPAPILGAAALLPRGYPFRPRTVPGSGWISPWHLVSFLFAFLALPGLFDASRDTIFPTTCCFHCRLYLFVKPSPFSAEGRLRGPFFCFVYRVVRDPFFVVHFFGDKFISRESTISS